MHRRFELWVLALVVAVFTVACGGAPPSEPINSARDALQQAKDAGAADYAKASLQAAQDAADALEAELKVQEGQTFRTYGKATSLAAAATKAAQQAISETRDAKAKAKTSATAAVDNAKKVLNDVQGLLAKAPKGTRGVDLDAMKTELTNASTTIGQAESSVTAGRFGEAQQKAESAVKAATSVRTDLEAAAAKKR
jgi:hypothetical protein